MSSLVVGSETNFVRDIVETLRTAEINEQDFVVVPLVWIAVYVTLQNKS
jgi:hypothetical protein